MIFGAELASPGNETVKNVGDEKVSLGDERVSVGSEVVSVRRPVPSDKVRVGGAVVKN